MITDQHDNQHNQQLNDQHDDQGDDQHDYQHDYQHSHVVHLQVAGCVRCALPCHLHLVSKLGLKFLAIIKIMMMMLVVVVVIMMMTMMMLVVICLDWPQVPEDSVY